MPLHNFSNQLLGAKDASKIRNVSCTYLFMMRIMKIMSLKGQMHNYRMKYTGEGISLTLVRSWTYDTMTISWGGVQVMDKTDPINLPATVTVALRHKS